MKTFKQFLAESDSHQGPFILKDKDQRFVLATSSRNISITIAGVFDTSFSTDFEVVKKLFKTGTGKWTGKGKDGREMAIRMNGGAGYFEVGDKKVQITGAEIKDWMKVQGWT